MTVYLGKHGAIELQRISGEPVLATLSPADVSLDAKRFSFADREAVSYTHPSEPTRPY